MRLATTGWTTSPNTVPPTAEADREPLAIQPRERRVKPSNAIGQKAHEPTAMLERRQLTDLMSQCGIVSAYTAARVVAMHKAIGRTPVQLPT